MVAKVTSQGQSFFVESGEDIHNVAKYDDLPPEDKRFLALESIKGIYRGFILTSGFHKTIVVTWDNVRTPPPVSGVKWEMKDTIALILPEGTRIEPRTHQQMEDELRVQQKPSLREK